MAEAYDTAIRKRLSTIEAMGANATSAAQSLAASRIPVTGGTNIAGMLPPPTASRQPVNYSGPPGFSYKGPRGNQAALRNFGKYLQSQGFRVSENSFFNGGHRISSGHVRGSKHYSDRAIDVNRYPGTSRKEQQAIDRIVGLAKYYGLHTIWRQKDHFNHAHFDY